MIKNTLYPYTETNLLENPQKYQMSAYLGKNFLINFFKSRKNQLKVLEKTGKNFLELDEVIKQLSINYSKNTLDDFLKTNIETEEILSLLLINFLNPIDNDITKILNEFIKKFEIKKRLYSSYDGNFKESSSLYSNLRNYLILSTLCMLAYKKNKNLKYLNTSLKLNDTICSQINKLQINLEKSLFYHILKIELQNVDSLCNSKKVGLN
jgi:hypothetical protein